MDAVRGAAVPVPVGWSLTDPADAPDPSTASGLLTLRIERHGVPAWLYTPAEPMGSSTLRRLRSELPDLDAAVRAVMAEPGALLLPWTQYNAEKGSHPFLICPRPGPTLADDLRSGPLPVRQVLDAAVSCMDTLQVLHRYGRAHAQISPGVLHREGTLVRLGSPLPPTLSELLAAAGGTGHEAPEILRGGDHDKRTEVFAVASTVWTLLSGRPPFGPRGDRLARLTAAEPPPLRRADVPAAVESALRAAISPDPARRPDLGTLIQALRIAVDAPAAAPPVASSVSAPNASPAPAAGSDGRQETLAPTRPVAETGQPLGSRYLLDSLVGRGATGHVWRGHVRGTGAPVAVKLLRSELAEDPDVVTRFMRERATLLRLSHPNLVAVRDLVAEGDALAIVMDLVDGSDLRAVLARGPLSVEDASVLLAQTASALSAVHAAGIAHRDLKPENVLVETTPEGRRARLTDFGLARAVEQSALTRATQLVGTPAYVAPEVVAGRPPGPPVDVYAFGITSYELLAGQRPFRGESTAAMLRAHLDEQPERPDWMSDTVWDVVSACLRKDPAHRPTADALAVAWQRISRGLDPAVGLSTVTDRYAPAPAGPPAAVAQPASPVPSGALPSGALPSGALPLGFLPSEVRPTGGVQDTTAARRPLAPRHAPPPAAGRSRKVWWIAAILVVVLGFGGGFAYFALRGDGTPKRVASLNDPYPLTTTVTLTAIAGSTEKVPRVRWTLPAGLATKDTVILVLKSNRSGSSATPITQGLDQKHVPYYDGLSLSPGECVLVVAYPVTKSPSGTKPAPSCLPTASAGSTPTPTNESRSATP